jgi:hypothetical protein
MKDNRLIAEFMEYELEGEVWVATMSKELELNWVVTDDTYLGRHLLFQTSWDWLMPVVEKIESLRDTNGNAYRFTIDMCNAQIEETNIEILGGAFKLDTTYKAVVEFINQNN